VNISDFPNYAQWLLTAQAQSRGALLVGLIALGGLAWLLMAWLTWPRLLPVVRTLLIGAFYVSLVILLWIGVHSV
jgi:hypothetical protein